MKRNLLFMPNWRKSFHLLVGKIILVTSPEVRLWSPCATSIQFQSAEKAWICRYLCCSWSSVIFVDKCIDSIIVDRFNNYYRSHKCKQKRSRRVMYALHASTDNFVIDLIRTSAECFSSRGVVLHGLVQNVHVVAQRFPCFEGRQDMQRKVSKYFVSRSIIPKYAQQFIINQLHCLFNICNFGTGGWGPIVVSITENFVSRSACAT